MVCLEEVTLESHRRFVVATSASKQETNWSCAAGGGRVAMFLSVPARSALLRDSGNNLGEKAMSRDSVNPRKSHSVELYENSHF